MGDFELPWSVRGEEDLKYLLRLILAGAAFLSCNGEFQIGIKPGRQTVCVTLHYVFADRAEHIETLRLRRYRHLEEERKDDNQYVKKMFHGIKRAKAVP